MLSQKDVDDLQEKARSDFGHIVTSLCSIHVKDAIATNPEDQKKIFGWIENGTDDGEPGIGCYKFETAIIAAVRSWLIKTAHDLRNKHTETHGRDTRFLLGLGKLYMLIDQTRQQADVKGPNVRGGYDLALETFEKCLELQPADRAEHAEIAETWLHIGKVHHHRSEYEKAVEKFTMALQMQLKLGLHVEAAVTQGEIGYTQFYQGKFKDALLSLREAEAVLLRTEDKEIEAARTQRNIGHCLYRLSKFDDAEKEFKRAIDTLKRRLVSDHPEIAETELRLGDTFKRQSDPRATPPLPEGERTAREQQAFELFCAAQRTLEKVYGEEHELVAQACNSKGHIYNTRKQYAEAKEHFDRAVRILKLLHGDKPHKDIADSLNCIGVIHKVSKDQREWPQALDYFVRARDLYCKIHSTENHIDVAACDNYAAEVYLQMSDYEGARKAAEKALETRRKNLKPDSRQVIASETLMRRIESAIEEKSRPLCQ